MTASAAHAIEDFWAAMSPANTRSQVLLERSGFSMVEHGWLALLTYGAGGFVFTRKARRNDSSTPTLDPSALQARFRAA